MDFKQIRQKYSDYDDMSDEDFAQAFHKKFYSDIPFEQFASKVGFTKGGESPSGPSMGDRALDAIKGTTEAGLNLPVVLAQCLLPCWSRSLCA